MKKKASAVAVVLALLALTLAGCPDPVDEDLLRVVEDRIAPDIELTSPQPNGEIRSTVTIAGRITDSSFEANDRGGVLDSITIQVQAEPLLTRAIKLDPYTVTPADPTFTFNFDTGAFSIVLDTSSIDRSREFIVTATDRNGNSAEVRRLLFPSDGMVVTLEEPGTDFTKFQVGGLYTIQGAVANSGDDPAISELKSLRWEIVQNPAWSADLVPSAASWNAAEGCYAAVINGPFPLVMQPFRLFLDGSFTSQFTIPASGLTTLTIRVIATDKNDVARTAEGTVVEDLPYPTFILNPPGTLPASCVVNGSSYYSSNAPSEIITVTGTAATAPPIVELKYDLSSTVGATVSRTYTATSVPPLSSVMDGAGNLTFTVDTTGRQGDILLTITAKSDALLSAPFPMTIRDDRTAPSITDVSIGSNNAQSASTGGNYARDGNTVALDFGLSDGQTGVDAAALPTVTIGNGAASVEDLGGGAFRATRLLPTGEPQSLPFTITARDRIGNSTSTSVTSDSSSVTFYEGPPTISGLAMSSDNASPTWARTLDVVTLFFAQARELAWDPTIQIASRGAAVTWARPNCTATMAMQEADGQGSIPFSIALTDAAGNTATITQAGATPSPNVTFDSSAPSVPVALDLDAASDSGASSTDDLTSASSWLVHGSEIENGTIIRLLLDAGQVVTTPANPAVTGGAWSATIDVSSAAQGTRSVQAVAVDAAGNSSAASTALTVNRDSVAPAVPSGLDLAASDDSGSSNSDNVTSEDSWQISGSHGIGTSTIRVLLDAALAATASVDPAVTGSWSVTVDASAAGQGSRSVQAVAVDAAGNSSSAVTLAVTRDTQLAAPSTPDLAAGSDSGASSSDNITNATTLTFAGTAEAGATVEILVGGVSRASGTADGSGNYSIAVNMSGDTGSQSVSARANDPAGNGPVACAGSLSVTIDRTAPAAPSTPDLAAGSDSGASSSDNITNATTLTFGGTAEAGATVEILVGGVSRASGTADGSGNYSIAVNMSSDTGAQSVSARATDIAGNGPVASAGSLSVTIDRAAPAVPTGLDLAASDDSGSSNSDNVTSEDSWQISGSHGIGTSTIRVLLDAALAATASVDPAVTGSWSVTVDASAAGQGSRSVQAVAVDAAGNSSSAVTLAVTRDTQLAAPSTPDLAAGSDSGASSSDNITNATTLTFTGAAEAGATVEILVGGVSRASGTADGSGNYSIAVNMSGDTGSQSVSARANDPAGNGPVACAGSLSVTIDRTDPTVTTFTPSDTEVLAADEGTLTLSFTYSESMRTSVNPTITFDQDLSERLTDGPSWSWGGNTATATYTLAAGGSDPAQAIVVTVEGAEDVAGNTQTSFDSGSGDFAVSRSLARPGASSRETGAVSGVSRTRPVAPRSAAAPILPFEAPGSEAHDPTAAQPFKASPRAARRRAAPTATSLAFVPVTAPATTESAALVAPAAAAEAPRVDQPHVPEPPIAPQRAAPPARPQPAPLVSRLLRPTAPRTDGAAALAALAACCAAAAALVAARIVRRKRGSR